MPSLPRVASPMGTLGTILTLGSRRHYGIARHFTCASLPATRSPRLKGEDPHATSNAGTAK